MLRGIFLMSRPPLLRKGEEICSLSRVDVQTAGRGVKPRLAASCPLRPMSHSNYRRASCLLFWSGHDSVVDAVCTEGRAEPRITAYVVGGALKVGRIAFAGKRRIN